MDVKPGYKSTDLGIIPENWGMEPCSALSDLITVGIVVRPTQYYVARGVPALRSANIREDGINYDDMVFISQKANSLLSKSQVRIGDVVTVRTGYPGTSAVVPSDLDGANCIDILITRPSKRISPTYLSAWINSPFGKYQVLRDQGGLAQQHFNVADLRSLIVAVPHKVEQEAIAEALSDADGLIKSLERLLIKKRQIKHGTMQELLTGKKRLPGFSGQWQQTYLGDLFKFTGGLSASRDQLSSEGYCYLHYGDIHACTKSFIDVHSEFQQIPKLDIPLNKVSSASLLHDGDVVFVDASEDDEGASRHVVILNPDRIPFISGLHTIVAKAINDRLVIEYRRYCFQTAAVRKQFLFYAVGTKVSGISKTNIAKILLPVPSAAEQSAMAAILTDMDAEIDALHDKLAQLRQIKQGMTQELLTGRIRLK